MIELADAAKAAAREPNSAIAQFRLGEALAAAGRAEEALFRFRRAAALDPADATPLIETGRLLAALGHLLPAETALRMALSRDGAAVEAQHGLGVVLAGMGRLEEAIDCLRAVPPGHESYGEAQIKLGNTLFALFRAEESLAVFEALRPTHANEPAVHLGIANALRALGRSAEAQAAYETALELAPHIPTLHRGVAEGKRFKPGDPQIAAMEELARQSERLPVGESVALHFALGKAYDDIGERDRAFENWGRGNALQHRMVAYDEAATLGLLAKIETVFSHEFLGAHAGEGDPSYRPVFIVGMPRSGTTLVEQILASHPEVFAQGEQRHLSDLLEARLGADFPASTAAMSADAWRGFGAAYVERLPKSHLRVTDKLPANFRNIGLIHLALPNARIIHVRREAMDTCFSCYSHLFPNGLEYTYDPGELARYHRAYEKLMAHWRRVLPPGTMLEIAYEDLVADLEGGTRKILAYCGLEFDARCLAFHKASRPVYTVSVEQVRAPLYASSVGRWKAYEAYLEPLKAALMG